jgi:hypothetical protein
VNTEKTMKKANGCSSIDPITATIKKIPVSVRLYISFKRNSFGLPKLQNYEIVGNIHFGGWLSGSKLKNHYNYKQRFSITEGHQSSAHTTL